MDDHAAPPHFLPHAPDRATLWAALPAPVQSHIQEHTASTAAAEQSAIGQAAWALRFLDAAAYKAQLLKRAHAVALRRLKREWDVQRYGGGARCEGGCCGGTPKRSC